MQKKQNFLLIIFVLFLMGFVFNFVWENLHYQLYECKTPLEDCTIIASFRDSLIILAIYAGGIFLFKEIYWIFDMDKRKIILLLIASFLIAYLIELQGIYLNKWSYSKFMILIPFINVGLSPILQMMILPIFVFYTVKLIIINDRRDLI